MASTKVGRERLPAKVVGLRSSVVAHRTQLSLELKFRRILTLSFFLPATAYPPIQRLVRRRVAEQALKVSDLDHVLASIGRRLSANPALHDIQLLWVPESAFKFI